MSSDKWSHTSFSREAAEHVLAPGAAIDMPDVAIMAHHAEAERCKQRA